LSIEPETERSMSTPDDSSRTQNRAILVGLVFIFAGVALLADRIGTGIHMSGRHWPLLLIVYGSVRFLTAAEDPVRRRHSRWTAAWLIYLGFWFLVNEFHIFGLRYDTSWPLLIVWAGVRIMSSAIENAYRPPASRVEEG